MGRDKNYEIKIQNPETKSKELLDGKSKVCDKKS